MQCFEGVWACHSLFSQAKHNLQRLSLVLGLSRQLVQFQHFLFFHLPFIYYACSIYFSKVEARGPTVQRACSGWWDGFIFFSCVPLPVLQTHAAFRVGHEASPGAGVTLTWWAMCRTLADELRRGRNPLWVDAIPIYPPSTEEQPFRKPSRSRQDSSLPSCLGAVSVWRWGGRAKRLVPLQFTCILVILLLHLFPRHLAQEWEKENSTASSHTSPLSGQRRMGGGTWWDPISCMGGKAKQRNLHSEQVETWVEMSGLRVLVWHRENLIAQDLAALQALSSALWSPWVSGTQLFPSRQSILLNHWKKHQRGRKSI